MSSCIKDLYDNDLVEKCSKSKNILLKFNFQKNKKWVMDLIHNVNSVQKK